MSASLVEVTWTMCLVPDDSDPMFTNYTNLFPSWAGLACNAEATAKTITEEVLGVDEVWAQQFDLETSQTTVYLHITAPAACAGWYEVLARRVVTAHATRVPQAAEAP